MCLYGNDIDDTTTLVEAGLGWIVSLDERKGDFLGRSVLAEQKRLGTARKLVGFEMVGRGIARHGYDVFQEGSRVGPVTSGTFAPFLEKSIGLCYLPAARSRGGDRHRGGRAGTSRRGPCRFHPVLQEDAMSYPKDRRYSRDHEWVRVEGDRGTVGITDFARRPSVTSSSWTCPRWGRGWPSGRCSERSNR